MQKCKDFKMLIFLDVETTGLEDIDRICSIGLILIENNVITNSYDLINEGKKISSKASSINHITNEMIKDKPLFKDSNTFKILDNYNIESSTIIGHNINFDIEMLKKSGFFFKGNLIDTLRISKHLIQDSQSYSLQFLRYELKLYKEDEKNLLECQVNETITPHNALSDAICIKELYDYHLKSQNIKMLQMLSYQPVLMQKLPFGKYEGKFIEEIYLSERGYLEWILNSIIDLDEDLRYSINYYLKGEL